MHGWLFVPRYQILGFVGSGACVISLKLHHYINLCYMKRVLTILWMCVVGFTYAQDTLFIKREIADTPYAFYHAIFIDTANNSEFRKRITDYSFDQFDSTTYFDALHCLEKPANPKNFYQLKGLPRNWVPLFQYKRQYYTYHASDWCCIFRFRITDTTTIDHGVEGPEPSWIKQIDALGQGQFKIKRSSRYGGDEVYITVIDSIKGIAVLQFSPSKFTRGFQILMVDADKAYLFPTIVNYCLTDRMEEVEFDTIDFSALLKRHPFLQ
jgi:hypothetical protein